MVVRLDQDMVEFVREMVSTGRYTSEEAVVATALRQLRDKNVKKAEIRRIILEDASTDPIHFIS